MFRLWRAAGVALARAYAAFRRRYFGEQASGFMTLSNTWFLSNPYFIPHRLMLLARMIDRETSRDLQGDSNLTAAEWRALAYICTMGSSSAAQICEAFEVDRAEVSRAVARLADAKLIQRGQERDRENRLTLTPTAAGTAVHDLTRAKRRAYFDWILQDLDPAERQLFEDVMARIAQRVDQRRSERSDEVETEQSVSDQVSVR